MRISYLFMPEDSRNCNVSGIDLSVRFSKESVLKTMLWLAVTIGLTAVLTNLG